MSLVINPSGGGNATVNTAATAAFTPAQAFVDFWQNNVFPGGPSVNMSPGTRATRVPPSVCAAFAGPNACELSMTAAELTLANMQAIGSACSSFPGTTLFFAGVHNANWPETPAHNGQVDFNLATFLATALAGGIPIGLGIVFSGGSFSITFDPTVDSESSSVTTDIYIGVQTDSAAVIMSYLLSSLLTLKSNWGGLLDALSFTNLGSNVLSIQDSLDTNYPYSIVGVTSSATLVSPGTIYTQNTEILNYIGAGLHGSYNSSALGVTTF